MGGATEAAPIPVARTLESWSFWRLLSDLVNAALTASHSCCASAATHDWPVGSLTVPVTVWLAGWTRLSLPVSAEIEPQPAATAYGESSSAALPITDPETVSMSSNEAGNPSRSP